jgi:hypothetical protein
VSARTSDPDGPAPSERPPPPRPGWLTDRVWARFLAVELESRRIAEVARAEGVSANAVWQSVRKARAAVRAINRAGAR